MDANDVKVRLNFSVREVEISGNPEMVEQWYARVQPYLDQFKAAAQAKPAGKPAEEHSHHDGSRDEGSVNHDVHFPANFGEFLHRFRPDVTDVDRMLIAGFFIEQSSDSKIFATGGANTILKEQGVRVTNASEALRRNLASRRVFKIGSRDFRTARPAGIEHLRSLLVEGSNLE